MRKNKVKKTALVTIILFIFIFSFSKITILILKNNEEIKFNQNKVIENNKHSISFYQKEFNNNDIVAFLEIPDILNILITQTDNNDYYLNHSISKRKDIKGSEFMDYRVNLNSKQINLYGHNSKTYNNIPFKVLEKYNDPDFFNQNKYIILSNDNIKRTYLVYVFKEVKEDYEHMKVNINEKNIISHLNNLEKNSINKRNIKYNENSSILILQTCSYSTKDSYYLLIAIEI